MLNNKLEFSIIDINDLCTNNDLIYDFLCKTESYTWAVIARKTYNFPVKVIVGRDENGKVVFYVWIYEIKNTGNMYALRNSLVVVDYNYCYVMHSLSSFCKLSNVTLYGFFIQPSIFSDCNNKHISQSGKKNIQLPLSLNSDKCWRDLPKKTRNMVRKGQKTSVNILDSKRNLNDFYNIYTNNMLSKKVMPHPLEFFENLMSEFGSDIELITATYKDKIIGGIIVQYGSKSSNYPFHSSDINYNYLAPNHLLVWEMIERCVTRGLSSIDMGEATDGSGVYNFKKSFGGVISNINEYTFNTGPLKEASDKVSIKSKKINNIKEGVISFFYFLLSFIPIRARSRIIRYKKRRIRLGI